MLGHLAVLKSAVEVPKALNSQLCYADPWVPDKAFSQDSWFPRRGWTPQRRWEERRRGCQLGVCHGGNCVSIITMTLQGLLKCSRGYLRIHYTQKRVPGYQGSKGKDSILLGHRLNKKSGDRKHLKLQFLGQAVNGKPWTECLLSTQTFDFDWQVF